MRSGCLFWGCQEHYQKHVLKSWPGVHCGEDSTKAPWSRREKILLPGDLAIQRFGSDKSSVWGIHIPNKYSLNGEPATELQEFPNHRWARLLNGSNWSQDWGISTDLNQQSTLGNGWMMLIPPGCSGCCLLPCEILVTNGKCVWFGSHFMFFGFLIPNKGKP